MPAKPTLKEVMESLTDLKVGMGAELASARLTIAQLTDAIEELRDELKLEPPPPAPPEPKVVVPLLLGSELELVRKGLKIDAIKALRARVQQEHGFLLGLKEAKDIVVFAGDLMQAVKPSFDSSNPPQLTEAMKTMVKSGKKIDAIKAYREYTYQVCYTGCGLKEAKDIVDAYANSLDFQAEAAF